MSAEFSNSVKCKKKGQSVMKKTILILAMLMLAATARADVTVQATQVGDTNEVAITYLVTSEPNLVRAFALDITVVGANIVDIKDYFTGESSSDSNGYGIFMGSIDLTNPAVPVWNNPVAPISYPNSAGEIPGQAITVEMGSLYKGAPNAPANSGLLCTIVVSDDCNVGLELEGRRGGITMETGDAPTGSVSLIGCEVVIEPPALPCMSEDNVAYATWTDPNIGEPNCWCYKFNCRGDSDDQQIGPFRVQSEDLAAFRTAFNKDDTILPSILYVTGAGVPVKGICADFDRRKIGPFRV